MSNKRGFSKGASVSGIIILRGLIVGEKKGQWPVNLADISINNVGHSDSAAGGHLSGVVAARCWLRMRQLIMICINGQLIGFGTSVVVGYQGDTLCVCSTDDKGTTRCGIRRPSG